MKMFQKLKIGTVASESGAATGAKGTKLFQNNEYGTVSVLHLTNQINLWEWVPEISSSTNIQLKW